MKRKRRVDRTLKRRRNRVPRRESSKPVHVSPSHPKYSFSGHQTFPFRYTWLPKGVRTLEEDPTCFSRSDAMVALGVGKNMVESIRFWCGALKLATIDSRGGKVAPTELGSRMFARRGWDPYLEDPGTLWLLHWQLVESPDVASTWFLAFTRWNRPRIVTKSDRRADFKPLPPSSVWRSSAPTAKWPLSTGCVRSGARGADPQSHQSGSPSRTAKNRVSMSELLPTF